MIMNKLKLRLKLKWLDKKLGIEIEENFGYCPTGNSYFDSILEQYNSLLEQAKKEFPDIYEMYN